MGTSQGYIASPILLNIYLHELDCFINENNLLQKFRNGKPAYVNPAFVSFLKFSKKELEAADNVKKMKGKRKYWKFLQKLRISKLKLAQENGIQRWIHKGINRKLAYVRYVYNFIIFV